MPDGIGRSKCWGRLDLTVGGPSGQLHGCNASPSISGHYPFLVAVPTLPKIVSQSSTIRQEPQDSLPTTPFLDNFRGADDAMENPWGVRSVKVTHTRAFPPALADSQVCLVGASGFEPPAFWSRTRWVNPINVLFGVANAPPNSYFPSPTCTYLVPNRLTRLLSLLLVQTCFPNHWVNSRGRQKSMCPNWCRLH